MAWTILNGPPGLVGIHRWTLGNNGLYLNNIDASFSQPHWPRIKLDRITGLHSRPDTDDNRDQRTGRIGEQPRPGLPRGKTVVYTGRLQAKTYEDLATLEAIMRAVFTDDSSDEGLMECIPNPSIGGTTLQYLARCVQCDIDDDQSAFAPTALPTPWQRQFTLGLRQSDSRYYAAGTAASIGPFTSGTTHTATNDGLAQTDPVIVGTTAGGVTVTLENLSVPVPGGHAQLVFDSTMPAGVLTVDFAARTALLNTGSAIIDAYKYLTTRTWQDRGVPGLVATTTTGAGANSIKVTGLSNWTVTWRAAAW